MPRVILIAFLFSLTLVARAEEPAGGDMPLDVYQKIKAHFDAMYGAQSALLPGAAPIDRKEVEANLKKDAAANKDVLMKALAGGKTIHRELAARALEYSGDKPSAVTALSKAVTADSDENVRRACAAALAKIPDAAAVEPLIKALSDNSDSVRGIVATALGNIKDNRATEGLLRVLAGDSKAMNRLQAANALAKIKDPASADGLKKALESDQDERVKIAVAGAIREVAGKDTAQTEPVVSAGEAGGELSELSKEMRGVEEKLRADRHDQAVQVQGANVEQRLTKLIEKIEKSCQSCSQCNNPKEGQCNNPKDGNKPGNKNNPTSGLKDSALSGAVAGGSTNAAQVVGTQDSWAKLPPAQRDELLQAFREDVPERWRKRLEAYFLSVAGEEAKDAEK